MNKAELVYHAKHAKGAVASYALASHKALLTHEHKRVGNVAIIIHVFYPELWHQYSERLKYISEPYHIFITTPADKLEDVKGVVGARLDCTILPFSNRGRDILPFLHALRLVDSLGYTSILKLHTKKSTHRVDGKEWAEGMLSCLLPDTKTVRHTLEVLRRPDSGLIGPRGEYLPLSVNFAANGMHMMYIISRLYGKRVSHEFLQFDQDKYGFFAGSMFWSPVSLLRSLYEKFETDAYFEKEKGQIDATFAHAIERVISIIPQIEDKKLFEVSSQGVNRVAYDSGVVPDWSSVAA